MSWLGLNLEDVTRRQEENLGHVTSSFKTVMDVWLAVLDTKNTSCIANSDIHGLNHNTASVPLIDHELVAEGSCSILSLSYEVHIVPYVVHLETDDGRVVNAREGGALWLNPRISPGPHPQRQSRPNPY